MTVGFESSYKFDYSRVQEKPYAFLTSCTAFLRVACVFILCVKWGERKLMLCH